MGKNRIGMEETMDHGILVVLEKLKERKHKGVEFDDFRKGFRLAARIFDLRMLGYIISTIREECGERTKARYVLLKEPKK